DIEGALSSCRGILYVGRSVGDEPTLISTMLRMWIHHVAIRELERILAQDQASDARLGDLQRLLGEELEEPLLLTGARGYRALVDRLMVAVDKGEVRPWQVPVLLHSGPQSDLYSFESLQLVLIPGSVKVERATILRYNNQFVDLARRPVDEQKAGIDELEAS